jgi:hypothetical protein
MIYRTKNLEYKNITTELLKWHSNIAVAFVQCSSTVLHYTSVYNGLKQGNASPPLLVNFVLDYGIMEVHENQGGLKLNWDLTF